MTELIKLNNGIEIPSVGLGVFRLENKETQQVVESALSIGYRHIDTAEYYANEEAVGAGVKASGIPRKEMFVTTKCWNENLRKDTVMKAFEKSLKKLDMDYVDLYLIHWPVSGKIQEAWKVFEQIYSSGRAKSIGVSNFKQHHLESLKEVSTITPAVNQIELHPYLIQEDVVEYCNSAGIKVEAWSPFAANKMDLFKEKTIVDIANKHSKTPAQVILRWDYQRGIIVIPKSSHKERQAENLNIFDFNLTDEDMTQISMLNKNKRVGADPDNFNF
jgi:Aldo/keto reductases, related to diketogulonate reductase